MSRRWQFDPFEGQFGGGRPPDFRPEFRLPNFPRRFWMGLAIIGAVILLLLFLQPIVAFFTDLVWFQALGLQEAYTTRVGLSFLLFAGSLIVSLGFAIANLLLALRMRSGALRTIGIRRRYLRTTPGWTGLGASAFVAFLVSLGAGSHWSDLALFTHYSATGQRDPVFGQDVAFYLLTLPFLHWLVNWAVGVVFLATILVLALYVWRGQALDFRLSRLAVAHVSALLALLALLFAFASWLSRFDFLYSHNSFVWGAGFADLNARIPLTNVAIVLAVLLAIGLAANVGLRRLWIPIAAIGIWILFGIVSGLYGAAVQRFAVTPNELSQERPFISREIQFTRRAFGLDNITTDSYSGDTPVDSTDIASDRATIDNLRLWDDRPLLDTYTQLQTIRTYYSFQHINFDRYTINGKYQQLELSARELDTTQLPGPAQTWVNTKLKYTHGYGLAASPVNAVTGEGLPNYVSQNIPVRGPLSVSQPSIYFGDTTNDYVVARTKEREFDFPQSNQDVYTHYTGTHGVQLGGTQRVLWSLRTGDFNLLISPEIRDNSEILYRRNILDRVEAIAPMLSYDSDPYIVVGDSGRLYWVIDAYTTASTYPYAAQEPDGENYIRNAVKVVIDAYEGTPTFYVAAPNDPLIRAYEGTFPHLFHPMSEISDGLQAHLRVPEYLFSQQADVYRIYHMTDPQVFYNREDAWAVPLEQTSPTASPNALAPYYVLMRLPNQSAPEYLQVLPFTPNGKQNMISWLAARCDPSHYGELVSIVLPKDKVVYGPQQISRRIYETPTISRDFTLLGSVGSQVVQGNLLVVPIGNSFLYFEPVYLRATGGGQSLPELKKVILADSAQVVYADTLQQALDELSGTATPTNNNGPPVVSSTAGGSKLSGLAAQAYQHYQAAQARLKAGDLSGYASEMQQVGAILQQMQGSGGSASPSPLPSPSRTP